MPEEQPPFRPRSSKPRDLGFTPRDPVRWLAPAMLARTGVQVVLSTVFGAFSDHRELESISAGEPLHLGPRAAGKDAKEDTGEDTGEYWFDYVADTGDGFHAVATVASQLAARELVLPDGTRLPAGRLLVLGGDECYPVASKANYTDRMVGPFRAMLPWTDPPRTLVALPGNHDWYDGLGSFLRQFCQGRWIGGWKTEQARSYFAVGLPGGWWLWGIDVALAGDIDKPQLAYFREMAKLVGPDDAIVLCWAMPAWVESGPDNPEGYAPLEFFERTVLPDRATLRLSLSGDLHHYARYQGQDQAAQQKITAGGGGAYLYPTHRLPGTLRLPPSESKDPNKHAPVGYELRQCYPSVATSRRLRWGIFTSVHRSPKFWAVPALVYLILGFTLDGALPGAGGSAHGANLIVTLVLVGGVWRALTAFADTPGRRGTLLGLGHTLAHLALLVATAFGVGAALDAWAGGVSGAAGVSTVLVPLACGVVGGVLGPLVVAGYLVAADGFGVNTDELFSAQAIGDYKSFLRIRIGPDGTLTVFPVKIERAVRWELNPDPADPRWFRPADGVEPVSELIEPPITIPKRPAPDRAGSRTEVAD